MFFTWSRNLVMQDKRRAMSSAAREAVRYVSAQSPYYNYDLSALEIRMSLSVLSGISGFDILLTDTNGVVVSCSGEQLLCPRLGRRVPQELLSFFSAARDGILLNSLGDVYEDRRYVTGSPMTVVTPRAHYLFGYMFLSSDTDTMVDIWRQFSGVFTLTALVVMLLTFLISLVMSKKMSEPINEMARAAHRFARGDFSVRVRYNGRPDEIGQLMQAFNAMADSLERSEILRSEFIANVSHELKTPMTVIAGFADGILDGTVPPENEKKYLEIISSETRRLSRLVRGMLDMSQIREKSAGGTLDGYFDIAEIIRVSLLSLGGKIEERKLDAAADLPEEPVIVRGDKDSITRVVYNLLDNAVKFADSETAIKVGLWKQGAKAFVSVEDSGETISEDEMPLIFDRFHKSDRSRGVNRDGVGLGLYIVKSILDNHNEDIYVTSRDGVTRFVFTLTLA
jgi:signal transduction histidine kinase